MKSKNDHVPTGSATEQPDGTLSGKGADQVSTKTRAAGAGQKPLYEDQGNGRFLFRSKKKACYLAYMGPLGWQ